MPDKPIYALSIKQPWAWLICKGFKDVENRNWRIGRKDGYNNTNFNIHLPCRIYVHASLKADYTWDNEDFIERSLSASQLKEYQELTKDLVLGAIIGEVTITECV